jgi:hypothetical protein
MIEPFININDLKEQIKKINIAAYQLYNNTYIFNGSNYSTSNSVLSAYWYPSYTNFIYYMNPSYSSLNLYIIPNLTAKNSYFTTLNSYYNPLSSYYTTLTDTSALAGSISTAQGVLTNLTNSLTGLNNVLSLNTFVVSDGIGDITGAITGTAGADVTSIFGGFSGGLGDGGLDNGGGAKNG